MFATQLTPIAPGKAYESELLPHVDETNTSSWTEVTAAIYGLGGLGVVGLTRLLSQALQLRFARTATTETRGIAQRRAPVKSMVRAGHSVRTAAAPDSAVNLLVALEASEALRAAPLLGLRLGAEPLTCLLCDLLVAPSTRNVTQSPSAAQIRAQLEQRGVRVITLRVDAWLQANQLGDVMVSSIVFGAVAAMFDLPAEGCEALLLQGLTGVRRDQNLAAFHWGLAQIKPPVMVVAAASVCAVNRPSAPLQISHKPTLLAVAG
jgi:Pyruvate/2-oxoacid:ferredoxin oxidoreductase gamma subunit